MLLKSINVVTFAFFHDIDIDNSNVSVVKYGIFSWVRNYLLKFCGF